MLYICSLPNEKKRGRIPELYTTNPAAIEAFARRWNIPGRGVFDCVGELQPDANRRSIETVARLRQLHVDIDFKDIVESPDEIDRRLRSLLLRPTEVRNSGGGRHVIYELKEPVEAGEPEFERARALLKRLAACLCGDPAPAHPAALLRRPGTHNSKRGEPVLVEQLWGSGQAVDIVEIEEVLDRAEGATLFTRRENTRDQGGADGSEQASAAEWSGPLDVENCLAEMQPNGGSVNATLKKVIPSLLCRGEHPDEVLDHIVETVMAMAVRHGLPWDKQVEVGATISRILSAYHNLLLKDYDPTTGEIPIWLPGAFHERWIAVLADEQRPRFGYNRGGFYVRTWQEKNKKQAGNAEREDTGTGPKAEPKAGAAAIIRFRLTSFGDMRPGLEPLYLIDELIPIKGLVDIWGKPKCFKSFVTLDMMLHVATGWEYRDRYTRQGVVVYCAFEGAHGYKKRVEALRRHYEITDDTDVPLYIMPGQANLIKDHKLLISDLKTQLGQVTPVAVVLDTLNKSLIGSESKDVDMSAYLRAAEAVRDDFGCVVIIVHHCGLDETRPRGHTSLPGAVDAQLAVAREGNTVTVTVEMMRDGPEDTSVVSVAQSVEVGEDANGKTLTSLVMTPGEAAATSTRRKWAPSLKLFQRALNEVLSGSSAAININGVAIRAADRDEVRAEFYRIYLPKGDTERQKQDNRKHRFSYCETRAQRDDLIGVRVLPNGQELMWLGALGTTDNPQPGHDRTWGERN